jgi:hypothetical protein
MRTDNAKYDKESGRVKCTKVCFQLSIWLYTLFLAVPISPVEQYRKRHTPFVFDERMSTPQALPVLLFLVLPLPKMGGEFMEVEHIKKVGNSKKKTCAKGIR